MSKNRQGYNIRKSRTLGLMRCDYV
ncbi:hypothetical protein F383_12629 [Gossypium arboreum]|uniref:Uncharacterized protein n=1 Tax=Gossypium arboreum TaxID=29729 RepID=A0A0B0PSA7_GOSAR|nr:hypothetical protein F383_12629 [Gossypium arboreum]